MADPDPVRDSESRGSRPDDDPWRDNELARRQRIREAASRPLGVNLADTLDLSEFAAELAEGLRRER
jgi:hypothetical protein